jgi:hypothetical protein
MAEISRSLAGSRANIEQMMKAQGSGGRIGGRVVQSRATPEPTTLDLMKAQLGLDGDGRILANGLVAEKEAETGHTVSGEEFLAKALEAVKRGHINTTQLTAAEMSIRNGKMPEAAVVKAVLTNSAYWPWA